MQAPRRRPDQLGEAGLDVHMDVLEGALELEAAVLHLGEHGIEPADDCPRILGRNNALMRQHFGMRPACDHILAIELAVDVDRGIYVRHDGVRLGGKPAAPHLVAHDGFLLMMDLWL